MDGPVLSGGVIVLVAVLLWMLYLLPSWRGRFQYNAAERNAVRLNQALRVLAETSETPGEVRLELNARTALAQQKLAKRVQSEREAAELEALRNELAATRADPVVRQARARRRVRATATTTVLIGLAVAGLGVWQLVATGAQALLWVGGALVLVSGLALQRMASVAARSVRRPQQAAQPKTERVAPELHDQGRATWTPRPLPEPMVSVAGSRAQVAQAEIEAQEERRKAARIAALRARAEEMAPEAPVALPAASSSPYARMGFVDDAEIEDHVRELLSRRAAG
ncbi:hypothetical protein [Microbacterium saperdae]|uniref:Large exoprotein n=1 Tax=Microbacterium saperdae TaxID=69368 RepID=A0A543BK26_9MICO|nr:hypothetical protein [Microbacterium saperdae]TQL85182.1 hypothetical protein FB560_0785 [Microbacterium saperdae]GGM56306.1 hypothetical protein GCM10010489_29910 [Microbacterium saperdae]